MKLDIEAIRKRNEDLRWMLNGHGVMCRINSQEQGNFAFQQCRDDIDALLAEVERLQRVADAHQLGSENHRKLGWTLMSEAYDLGILERDEYDDCPKPKEHGGTIALAEMFVAALREKIAEIDRLRGELED